MPSGFLKNFVISFVVLFVVTVVYHNVVLGAWYKVQLLNVSTVLNGEPQADFPAFLVAIVMTAIGYAWFVPTAGAGNRMYLLHGALMGMATLGTFTFFARALVGGWNLWLTGSDFFFGVLSGLIMGAVFMFTEKRR
jgi:uncharacterized membrane protein